MKETKHIKQTVEYTSPVWRLVGVVLMIGGIGALGVWVRDAGLTDPFSTIAVITVVTAATGWARQRPDRLKKRFGVFGSIALEVQKSADKIRAAVYDRPLRFLIPLGIGYGVFVVGAKFLVAAALTSLFAWTLALGIAGIIAALVTVPDFFKDVFSVFSIDDEDEEAEENTEDEDEEDELTRRRRASGEE